MVVPTTDTTDLWIKPGRQRTCRLDKHLPVCRVMSKPVTIAKAAPHLKTHIMGRPIGLFIFHQRGELLRLFLPLVVLRKFIQHPKLTWKKTTGPVPRCDRLQLPILDRTR